MKSEFEKSWTRLPEENSRQYSAFCIFRDMGPKRSIPKVDKEWSSTGAIRRLRVWAAQNHWKERVVAYDDYIDEIKRTKNEEAILEMTARHADYSLQIQEKAIESLKLVDPGQLKPHEVIKMIETAVKIERLSRGVPTENIKQENEVIEVKKDVITPEKLKNPEVRKAANEFIRTISDS